MLENLFHAFRSATPSKEPAEAAPADAVTLVTKIAARLLDVPLVLVLQPESGTNTLTWRGLGAERVVRLPPLLLQSLGDPQGFAPFVVRDVLGEGRWKIHPLAGAIANIGLIEEGENGVRFAAAAPLRIAGQKSPVALLVIDSKAHPEWSDAQTATLCDLADLLGTSLANQSTSPVEGEEAEETAPPSGAMSEGEMNAEGLALVRVNDDLRAEIAERRRSEETLRDSEQLFRSVIQSASDAIVLCDGNARVVAWNKGAARTFGYSEEAVLGRPLWDLLSRSTGGRRAELERLCRDEVRRLSAERSAASRSGEGQTVALPVFEALGRRATGGEFSVELSLGLWNGEQNVYLSAIIRDVSVRQQADSLRALSHAVSRILAEAPTLDEAGHGILRAVGESRAWSMGGLWLIKRSGAWAQPGQASPTGPVLRLMQSWSRNSTDFREIDAIRRQSSYACGVGLPGRVWAAGEPFWIEDLTRDPHTPRASALARSGMRASMGSPIRFGHEILGVIDLYSSEPLVADPNFMEMAAAFGNQIGQFIARKQVEQEIRSRARQQATVARLGQRALARAGSDQLIDEAAALVSSTLAVDGCSFLELLPDGKILRTRASVGGRPSVLGEIGIPADASSQAGWTLLASEPVVVNDYRSETRFAPSPVLGAAGAVSGVSVVIPGGERPFGVLMVHAAHERTFAADDVHFLEAVANVVAAAQQRDQNEMALQKARDEAEEARLEAETSRTEAERANRAKSDFLSRMSHELRTPLNAILGFCQLLEMDDLTPEQGEYVHQVGQGGAHLLKLINEVLQLARIEAGRLSLVPEAVALGHLTREATQLVSPLAAARGITMKFTEGKDWEREIYADRHRLHEILLNFLSNAVKYNHENGEITLSCQQMQGRLRLSVADTGPGIPANKMVRLFQPFDRLGAESSMIEGTGLGLALVKHIAEAMGGTVGAQSDGETGSVFWVEMPLWNQSSPVVSKEDVVPISIASTPLTAAAGTVLCIEDNAANMRLIESLLARYPHIELMKASRGQEGLEAARRNVPDVVLLDIDLPDIPGLEVLRRLQSDAELLHVPVIIVSADASASKREEARNLGAYAYLTKPLNIRALFDVLGETLPVLS